MRAREARLEMARLMIREGRLTEALAEYEALIKKDPKDAEALRGSAEALTALGRDGEARPRLEQLLTDAAKARNADWIRLGRLHAQAGRKGEAQAVLDRLAKQKIDPDDALALVDLEVALGRLAEAQRRLDGLPPAIRGSVTGREAQAALAMAAGQHQKAVAFLRGLTRERPADDRFRRQLADALTASGGATEALRMRLATLKPDSPRADVVATLRAALEAHDLGTARRLAGRLTGPPVTIDEALARADVLLQSRRAAAAVTLLESARKAFGASPELTVAYAGALLAAGRPQAVVNLLEKTAGRGQGPAILRILLARAYFALGRWLPARKLAGEAGRMTLDLGIDLDLAELWLDLFEPGEALELASRPGEGEPARRAVLHARSLAALGATDDEVLKPIARFRGSSDPDAGLAVGHLLYLLRRDEEAAVLVSKVRRQDPPDPRLAMLDALIEYRLTWDRQGMTRIADRYLDKLEDLGPIQEELAEVLMEAGLPRRALAVLERAAPGGPPANVRTALRARVLYRWMGDVAGGRRLIDELIGAGPAGLPPPRRLTLAELMVDLGEARRARALLVNPDLPSGLRTKSRLVAARLARREPRREDPPTEAARLLIDHRPHGIDERVETAEALADLPDLVRALALIEHLDSHRTKFRAGVVRARVQIQRNQLKAADHTIAELNALTGLTPDEVATVVGLELQRRHPLPARELAKRLPPWWRETQAGKRLRLNFVLLDNLRDEAVQLANAIFRERPLDADAAGLEAQAFTANRLHREALRRYDALIARRPEDDGFETGRAQALRALSRPRDAYAQLKAIAERHRKAGEPVPIGLTLVSAGVIEDLFDYKRARELYENALKMLPGDPEVLKGLSRVHGRMDRPGLALKTLEDAQKEEGIRRVDDLPTVSGYLKAQGARGKSIRVLEHALELDPKNAPALSALGATLSERDQTRKAGLALHKRAVAADPGNIDVRTARAAALLAAGRHREADRELERVHAKSPRFPAAQRVRADLELAHGRTLPAEKALRRLKREAGPDPSVEVGLSRVAEARGNGYLVERVQHAFVAWQEAPRRDETHKRLDQVLRTRYGLRYEQDTDTNTLTNRRVRGELAQILDASFDGALRLEQRATSRRGVRAEGVDIHLDGTANVERGTAIDGTLTVGTMGTNQVDLLPSLEVAHRTPSDWSFSYRIGRARVDESPEALLTRVRAVYHLVSSVRQVGSVVVGASFRYENVNDGNERRIFNPRIAYRFHPRLTLSYDFQHQSALFTPNPVDLYFAPLSYQLQTLDLDWEMRPTEDWTVFLGIAGRREKQLGQSAPGVSGRYRVVHRVHPDLEAFASGNILYSEANRRQAQAEPYRQDSISIGLNGRF